MKFLKRIIIVIILIIIVALLLILALLKNNKEETETNYGSYENGADQVIIDTKLKEVTEPTYYYTVYDCIVNYIKAVTTELEEIDEEDYIPGGEMNYFEIMGIETQEEKNQYIYNLLDFEYIDENNITVNNVNKYLDKGELDINFNIEKMYEMLGERIYQYVVYLNVDENTKVCFLISLDTHNFTYMVRPVQYIEYDKLKKEDFYENIDKIDENENNTYEYNRMSDEDMAKKYFYNFKNNIINKPSYIFEKFNEEYKKIRFKDFNQFNRYVEEDEQNLLNISLSKYLVNVYDDYTEYVCRDQYDNTYIFKASAVMNYELMLDTYTLETDKFKETYENASEQEKVQLNVDKFIKMINAYDFINAYDYLSDGFKENYFNTEEDFEEYIKSIFFRYNKVTYKDISKKGNDIYVSTLQITDSTGESTETKDFSIIIQLKDETDFSMSFEVK